MIIGILREEKVPSDFRVPFTPQQLVELKQKFNIDSVIQPSKIRCFDDDSYRQKNIKIDEDLSKCDYIFGVKEVPINNLLNGKNYVFFSHTIKGQLYNQDLMRGLIAKKITMIDYELLLNKNKQRVVAFGVEAGIVGAYNAIRTFGERSGEFDLPLAQNQNDVKALFEAMEALDLSKLRIMITGRGGRVSKGAISVLAAAGLCEVSADEYLKNQKNGVFVALSPTEYMKKKSLESFKEEEFFKCPTDFKSDFLEYAGVSDIYISAHFWDKKSPVFFTKDDIKNREKFKISIISDISCDMPGPIATTLRETDLENIAYDVCRDNCREQKLYTSSDNITVTAVDNLPSAIAKDASCAFGNALIREMIVYIQNGDEGRIENAKICENGKLKDKFSYLKTYAGLRN